MEEALSLVTRLVLGLIAFLAVIQFLQYRDRARLNVALMLASLGLPAVSQALPVGLTDAPWVTTLTAMAVVAQPYLLLRLVEDFRPVPRLVMMAGIAGMVLSWIPLIVYDSPLPPEIVLGIVAYFVVFELYAVVAFALGARAFRGVSRWRHGLAASGSALLAGTILLAAVTAAAPGTEEVAGLVQSVLLALVAVCYYLGFTPPRWLRDMWQLPELRGFLHSVAGQPPGDRANLLLHELCTIASRAAGGLASVVFLWREERQAFVVAESDVPDLRSFALVPDGGPLSSAWKERRSIFARDLDEIGEMSTPSARLAARFGACALLAVPVATPQRAWGALLVLQLRGSLFPQDDLALLEMLGEQCAMALDNEELVAEQQRLAAEERRLANRLEAANQELEAFAYSVSHDLRGPLRGIDGFSQALLEDYGDELDQEAVGHLRRVRSASQLMGRLIDDLLKLSRVSRSELQPEQVDLSAIAYGIVERLRQQDPERRVRFLAQDGVTVHGDRGLLQIALENLLQNAWKFTSKHPFTTIQFGADGDHENPRYFVRDDGAGFDMTYADKLFRPFQRLHGNSEFAGTGIGLATVQRIVSRHGGRVWAEGAIERGATFYFTLQEGVEHDRESTSAGRGQFGRRGADDPGSEAQQHHE